MNTPNLPLQTKRLSAFVDRPGGVTEDEAVAGATANLEALRGRTLGALTELIQQMQELGSAFETTKDSAKLDQLYVLSNSTMNIAGIFGLNCLSAVAYSLCDLIDRLRTCESSNMVAIQIHLDSLRLLQTTEPPRGEAMAIQAALRQLVGRVAEISA